MRLLATIFLASLLISMAIQQKQLKEGGLTMQEWHKKCKDHFDGYPQSTEKAFRISGYCNLYVCEKFSGQIAMRIDSCPKKAVNGKICTTQKPTRGLPYPKCCKLKC